MGDPVTLRNTRNADGTRYLGAQWGARGDLIISGQDLGKGVEDFFGPGNIEYEWAWTVRAADVPRLAEALGGSRHEVLLLLAERFSGRAADDLKPFLDAHKLIHETWTRVGD